MALSRSTSKIGDGSTIVAIDRDKNIGQPLVKWAVDNILQGHKKSHCVILHVIDHGTHSHHQGASRSPAEELQETILPCLGYCARKGITAQEVILHDIDIPSAIIDYIVKNDISNVVVGASNRNAFTRKFKEADVPTSLIKSVPDFCSVYVISKGKTQTVRAATQALKPKTDALSTRSSPNLGSSESASSSKLSANKSSNFMSVPTQSHGRTNSRSSLSFMSTDASQYQNSQSVFSDFSALNSSGLSQYGHPESVFSDFSVLNSIQSTTSKNFDSFTTSESSGNTFILQTPEDLEAETSTLSLQLKRTMDIYNSICNEATEAKERVNQLHLKPTKDRSLEEARLGEEAATAFADLEKQKPKLTTDMAHIAERIVETEKQERKIAEMKASQEREEKPAIHGDVKYRRYTIKEIESATDYFNDKQKIGEGGYGPVYKGFLDHTPVAIKILRPDISQGLVQFQREVEVLSYIRHPNMVLLVGACPEYGCLVYEYMDNGSLEDRLFCKGNTPPLSWKARFKIAAEIATALLFLHQRKPEPLVHRDLKPANILLDQNYVSKISDVGLARLVPASLANTTTQYHQTAAAGTFCYIDPEYQQTGLLGVKSDVYSLGVMLLQIITSKPPIGLSFQVEEAIERGKFSEILDPMVWNWPVEDALSFAKLALQCCEMRKKDRPDLGSVVLPELNRLRNLAMAEDGN